MKRHFNIYVYGRVQMVGFRFHAKAKAERFGVVGFSRNESDGSVYIEAEGHGKSLKRFIEWCKKGPMFANVKRVEVKERKKLKNFNGFKITF
ncbi:MAG TPA: acylphosphatase [Candidatus Jorgensenbacteria bacterium]|nr:acylphosphatase [Candidatus Jorgensenbacteria bacterium]